MIGSLDLQVITEALPRVGLTQSDLARKLDVSREAVSKWFRGDSVPKPDRLLRLGVALGLTYEQIITTPLSTDVPIVCFRRKAARKTRDSHLDGARQVGELLKRLVKYFPEPHLTEAPVLREPRSEYAYVQRVARNVRKEMELDKRPKIEFEELIDKFRRLHAILVPVLWGEQDHHGNALNVHLPDSRVTWVFLNLDSNAVDFKFWMAHELGHAFAPALSGDDGEDFADAFAQALLFPEGEAAKLHAALNRCRTVGTRINKVKEIASELIISPYTIRLALQEFEDATGQPRMDLGLVGPFMGATKNFTKKHITIAEALFGKKTSPGPAEYIAATKDVFHSQFFKALVAFCEEEKGAEHFIHQVLQLPLTDAKALSGELTR